MNAAPKNISFLLVLILLAPLVSHCGKSRPAPVASRGHWFSPPAMPSVVGKRPPATQRPYVIDGVTYYPIPSARGYAEQGVASWYGPGFHGRKTSNGETYDMYEMTAAHKTLPMDTRLFVKNLDNGSQTVVRINDRGPFIDGRIIDLSHSAARALGIVERGTARVKIVAIDGKDLASVEEKPAVAAIATPRPAPRQAKTAKAASQRGRAKQSADAPNYAQDYFIHVDSFSRQQEARRLQQRFAGYGHNANLYRDHDGAIKVVLFVGNNADQARRERSKLLRLGYTKAKVISVAN
ncbi:MAG: septal ring lytic transglycosylase RlpA family protein [Desulfobulbaceae bacterium]|jgi:rare lipoprotein A|nr:septal ring lytic transglycosylase RlpA family protein [Desulfobulbaceae bacterium]